MTAAGDLFPLYSVLLRVVFICAGIPENLMIFWVLARRKKCLKSFSNFHLLNLAVTDILFRIISTAYVLQERLGVSDRKCKAAEFGIYTTLAVTFSLLAGNAFDRYIHIVHPLKARTFTWKRSRNLVIVSWIYGAVCSAPFLYSTRGDFTDDNDEALPNMCECYQAPGLPFQISITVFFGCSFLIPLVYMGFAYGKLLRVLWKRARTRNLSQSPVANAKIRAVKMMVLVVLTYLVTWGPFLIWKIIEAFLDDKELLFEESQYEEDDSSGFTSEEEEKRMIYLPISMVFETMTFFSSVLNPVIFGHYNRSFREEVKNIICRSNCRPCFTKCKQERSLRFGKIGGFTLDSIEAKETNFQSTRL